MLIDLRWHATMITKALTLACVVAAALVQTQRTSPAQFALGGTVDEVINAPWRILLSCVFSSGFSVGFLLVFRFLAAVSVHVERAAFAAHGTRLRFLGAVLVAFLLLVAGSLAEKELRQPFLLCPLLFCLAYLYLRLPDFERQSFIVVYLALFVMALLLGASFALGQMLGVGAGVLIDVLELLPARDNAPGAAAKQVADRRAAAAGGGGAAAAAAAPAAAEPPPPPPPSPPPPPPPRRRSGRAA